MCEFAFRSAKGWRDTKGEIYKEGVMRLATAANEIIPMKDTCV